MPQFVTRLSDELAEQIDELIRDGLVASRSEAVRRSLELLVKAHRRRREAEATIAAYLAQPQTPEELLGVDEAAIRMIEEEPW